LREHERLRGIMGDALALAGRARDGTGSWSELQRVLDELRDAFAEHNASEEALLVPILGEDATIGPARIARMIEEHAAEHAAFRAALAGAPEEVAIRLEELAEEIDAHMAAEERTFLSPGVLRP
jgi:iron-sulfur cluster repair protein YtfE (RIC family)